MYAASVARTEHPLIERHDAVDGAHVDEEAGLSQIIKLSGVLLPLLTPSQPKSTSTHFYHRDFLKREFSGPRDDRFISPRHGRLTALRVQSSGKVLSAQPAATWNRVAVKGKGPTIVRIANWALRKDSIIRWLPASGALAIMLLNPLPVTTTVRNNGFYEPFLYRDWQYPYGARNPSENPPSSIRHSERGPIDQIERASEPKYLCLAETMKIFNVAQWRKDHGSGMAMEYIFVSYTSQHFRTTDDYMMLHAIGKHAAEAAQVKFYWVGCSCQGSPEEVEENVWRISDVIRGAFQVVVAVAGPIGMKQPGRLLDNLLRDWGNRVWILPELFLSPEHDDIRIHTVNRSLDRRSQIEECLSTPPDQINRRNFSRFWEDDKNVGQLIDHYEGSVILSQLELVITALRCLGARHTTQYLPGDLSYALMGLLRQRPNAWKSASAFQAFARLSLANDSNRLLERLICLLPESPFAPWYSFKDYWEASLWDIHPRTQVCGIGKNDTIILDGARAANIRWKSFDRVILRGNDTVRRTIVRLTLSFSFPFLPMAIMLLAIGTNLTSQQGSGGKSPLLQAIGGTMLGIVALICLFSPIMVNWLYNGKVWAAQPWFFGIEGYVPLDQIERHLFAVDMGRLSWSTTASPLSKHDVLQHPYHKDYCEGQNPSSYQDVAARIERALRSGASEDKVFTLVDTYTMTVTLFTAVKPPVAVLCCGGEGGMQRALLCSYDWTDSTLYRETVLRMETRAY
ncbi:MAG: hypothetical protein Q9194_000589 [Teloschistes cf. exilis]